MNVAKNSQQNNSETVTNENNKEIPKKCLKERRKKDKKIIDNLRLNMIV